MADETTSTLPTPVGYLTPQQQLQYAANQRREPLFKQTEYRSWTQPVADILRADAERRYFDEIMGQGQRQAEQGARSAISGLPGAEDIPDTGTSVKSTGFGAITDPIAKGLSSLTAPISGAISGGAQSIGGGVKNIVSGQRGTSDQPMPEGAYVDPGYMRT